MPVYNERGTIAEIIRRVRTVPIPKEIIVVDDGSSDGIDAELTAKVARRKFRIYQVGITYFGRTYEEGKKIGRADAFRVFYCILRYWWGD